MKEKAPVSKPASPVAGPAVGRTRPPIAYLVLAGLTAVALVIDMWAIFYHAPIEARMGVAQKIFYFHVPSAYSMYVGFVVSGICSAVFLYNRKPAWEAWAVAGAEVGMLFCVVVLTTGPLWARKAWGIYWTWDPRLTSTLLAGLVFAAYLALRSIGSAGMAERKFAAGLSVFGLLDLPIIHYATRRWGGQHPTVITKQGGGLHPDMKTALIVSFAAFTLLVVTLLWARARAERTRARVREAEMWAAERGLLEDV